MFLPVFPVVRHDELDENVDQRRNGVTPDDLVTMGTQGRQTQEPGSRRDARRLGVRCVGFECPEYRRLG